MHTDLQPVTGACIRIMSAAEREFAALAEAATFGRSPVERIVPVGQPVETACLFLAEDERPAAPLAMARINCVEPNPDAGWPRRILIEYVEFKPVVGQWFPSIREVMVSCAIVGAATVLHEDGVPTMVGLVGAGRPAPTGVDEALSRFSAGLAFSDAFGVPSDRSAGLAIYPVTDFGLRTAAGVLREVLSGHRVPTMGHGLEHGTTYSRRMTLSLPGVIRQLEEEIGLYADGHQTSGWLARSGDTAGWGWARRAAGGG